jgi:hypothetical protein
MREGGKREREIVVIAGRKEKGGLTNRSVDS